MVQKRAKNLPFRAEQLPTEIWICIFTYLEGHDIVRSFAFLNSFFTSLLRSSHVPLHIRVKRNEAYARLPPSIWSHIRPQNVQALSVGHRRARCLIQFLRWRAPYLVRLRTLSVYLAGHDLYNRCQTLGVALQQLPSLNSIRIRYIGVHGRRFDLDPVLTCIFAERPTINRCFFDFDWTLYHLRTSNWFINPKLTSLRIAEISWHKLICILMFTPHLHALQASLRGTDDNACAHFTLLELRKLKLIISNTPFALLQTFKEAAPCLQRFELRGTFNAASGDYFRKRCWQQLLCDVEYFDMTVTTWEHTDERKRLLPKRISDLQNKSWFHWSQEGQDLKVRISFKSLSV